MKNQERVWKAEQADAAEKRKLMELQQEIQSERNREDLKRIGQSSGILRADDDKRLEWMYKGPENMLNREEYLTGRAVDKHFEQQDAQEKQKDRALIGVTVPKNHVEHECIPFSIRSFRGAQTVSKISHFNNFRMFNDSFSLYVRPKSKSIYSEKLWKIH